jgi:hypothetical protein
MAPGDDRTMLRAIAPLAAVLAALAAQPAAAQSGRTLQTRGWIRAIAADGGYAAVTVARGGGVSCDRALLWNVAGGVQTLSSGPGSRTCPRNMTNGGIGAVAIGGTNEAWVVTSGGNTEQTQSLVSGAPSRTETTRLTVRSDPESGSGVTFAGVAGQGADIFYATTKPDLGLLVSTSLRHLPPPPAAERVVASVAERVVTIRGDGRVAVRSATGAGIAAIVPDAPARNAAITGDRAVVLRIGSRIEIWSASGAGRIHVWPVVAGSSTLLGAYDGYAVYTTERGVHVLRYADGRDRLIATTPRDLVGAAITKNGLTYAYNSFGTTTGERGHAVFVPFATVRHAFA